MPELSKGDLTLVIPASQTSARSPIWQLDGTSLKSPTAPVSASYKVSPGEYTVTVIGHNYGTLPIRPGYSFDLSVGGKATKIREGVVFSDAVKIVVPEDGNLIVIWENDDYLANKYDANLRLVEIRLDPTDYDPTFDIVKKLTAPVYTPLSDKEAQWLLGV